MRRNWKQSAVAAVVMMLVGTAVFLNWKYTKGAEEASEEAQETGTKILGESMLVSNEAAGSSEETAATSEEDAVYTGSDYFASARLTRQQARDNAIHLLQDAAAEEDADTSVANQASESIQVLASYTLTESQIENLVTAKGYTDCVAFMNEDSISVVVGTDSGELTSADVAKITDIAKTETGYPADSIKIMAAK